MKFDWTHGGTLDFALKLVVWLLWSAEQSLPAPIVSILSRVPLSGPIAIGAMVVVALVSIWVLMRLIKLLVMGSLVATVGLVALYFVQR